MSVKENNSDPVVEYCMYLAIVIIKGPSKNYLRKRIRIIFKTTFIHAYKDVSD